MSFVSVVGSDKYISVMSDGLVLGREKEVLEEGYQKFVKIGDFGFIAYAGDRFHGEKFAYGLSFSFPDRNFEKMAEMAVRVFKTADLNSKDVKVMTSFGGVNFQGDIEFYSVSSVNFEVQKYKPRQGDINYCFLFNQIKEKNIKAREMLEANLKSIGWATPSQAIQAQRLTNNYVADNDPSVNKKTSKLIIKKT